jgi:hypothetical protein
MENEEGPRDLCDLCDIWLTLPCGVAEQAKVVVNVDATARRNVWLFSVWVM